MKSVRSCLKATLLAAAASTWACSGSISQGDGDPGGSPRPTNPNGGGSGMTPPTGGGNNGGGLIDGPGTTPGGMTPGGGGPKACTPGATLPATPRLMRLTRQQYINAVRDLTGVEADSEIPTDPAFQGFNRSVELEVGEALSTVLRDQAEAVAKQVAGNRDRLRAVTGCDPTAGATCASTFVDGFGKRVFRRPLTSTERTRLLALFNKGGELVEGNDAFAKGVQVVVEALLQSPKFLYRMEESTKADNGLVALSSWEIASRLAFTIANTTPDPELMKAAEANELVNPDKVVAHARRLMESAAGRATVRDFHQQWLRMDGWTIHLDKDSSKYPTVNAKVLPVFVSELQAFAEDVAFGSKKGLTTLLTAPYAYVTKLTAPLYGLRGTFGDQPTKAELDKTKRAGLLTQVGFLAGNALSSQSSPIHRGVAIHRYVLCTTIPDPTVQVPALPPPTGTKTTREVVDEHTSPDACSSCHHSLINPVGHGLENFDAVGQWRDKDNSRDVDATGRLAGVPSNETPFTNPVEMMKAIAETPEARSCYVKQWWQYAFGRREASADACAIETLAASVGSDAYTAADLLVDMTRTRAFMYRNPEAL